MTTVILALRLLLAAHPAPSHAERPGVTVLDLSGPAEIESPFPTISRKGSL